MGPAHRLVRAHRRINLQTTSIDVRSRPSDIGRSAPPSSRERVEGSNKCRLDIPNDLLLSSNMEFDDDSGIAKTLVRVLHERTRISGPLVSARRNTLGLFSNTCH